MLLRNHGETYPKDVLTSVKDVGRGLETATLSDGEAFWL